MSDTLPRIEAVADAAAAIAGTIESVPADGTKVSAVLHIAAYVATAFAGLLHALTGASRASAAPHTVEERNGLAFDGSTAKADVVVVPQDAPFARSIAEAYAQKGIPVYPVPHEAAAFAASPVAATLATHLGADPSAFAFPTPTAPVPVPETTPTDGITGVEPVAPVDAAAEGTPATAGTAGTAAVEAPAATPVRAPRAPRAPRTATEPAPAEPIAEAPIVEPVAEPVAEAPIVAAPDAPVVEPAPAPVADAAPIA